MNILPGEHIQYTNPSDLESLKQNNRNRFFLLFLQTLSGVSLIAGFILLGIHLYFGIRNWTELGKQFRASPTFPELHVIGVHEGTIPSDSKNWVRCPSETERCLGKFAEPVGVVHIRLVSSTRPTILALMAHEPVLWNILNADRSNIQKVVVGGHESQAIRGLAPATPLEIHTYEESLCNGCHQSRNYFLAFNKGDTIEERGQAYQITEEGPVPLNNPQIERERTKFFESERQQHALGYQKAVQRLEEITGLKEPSRFYGVYKGDVFQVGSPNLFRGFFFRTHSPQL